MPTDWASRTYSWPSASLKTERLVGVEPMELEPLARLASIARIGFILIPQVYGDVLVFGPGKFQNRISFHAEKVVKHVQMFTKPSVAVVAWLMPIRPFE